MYQAECLRSNISSAINYIASNLCAASFIKEFFHYLPSTIALFGKLVNSEVFHLFASKIIGEHRKIDIQAIERYFIDDIYSFTKPQFEKNENIKLNEFIDAFYSFSDMNQSYIVHKFIGKPIFEIEELILIINKKLERKPSDGLNLAFCLLESVKEDMEVVKNILSYTNYQYRLLSNKLANTILDCAIVYFNFQVANNIINMDGNYLPGS